MRPSMQLLLYAVVPGALSAVVWSAMSAHDDPRDHDVVVRVHAEEELAREIEAEVAEALTAVQVSLGDAGRCAFGVERTLRLDAVASDLLRIDAGSGSLSVEGARDVEGVEVTATMCASSEDLLSGLDVDLERDGDAIRLGTAYPSTSGIQSGNRYARIDLVVRTPLSMAADIEDSSGEMRLAGLGDLTIDDSSGSIDIRGANGDVRIDDGSGEVHLQDIAGDVEIEDGSGELEIMDVSGGVVVSDGSGSLRIADVGRSVRILRDGSGSIDVSEVAGDFTVDRDGSGSIRYARIGGRVDVPEKRRRR